MKLDDIKKIFESNITSCIEMIMSTNKEEEKISNTIRAHQIVILSHLNLQAWDDLEQLLGLQQHIQEENYLKLISHIYELSGNSRKDLELEGWQIHIWLVYCIAYLFEILIYLQLKKLLPGLSSLTENFFTMINVKKIEDYIFSELCIAGNALHYYSKVSLYVEKQEYEAIKIIQGASIFLTTKNYSDALIKSRKEIAIIEHLGFYEIIYGLKNGEDTKSVKLYKNQTESQILINHLLKKQQDFVNGTLLEHNADTVTIYNNIYDLISSKSNSSPFPKNELSSKTTLYIIKNTTHIRCRYWLNRQWNEKTFPNNNVWSSTIKNAKIGQQFTEDRLIKDVVSLCGLTQKKEALKKLAQEIAENIKSTKPGEIVCLPLRWTSITEVLLPGQTKPEDSAHAVYMSFKRKDVNTVELLIDNLGLGCSEIDNEKKSYYPIGGGYPLILFPINTSLTVTELKEIPEKYKNTPILVKQANELYLYQQENNCIGKRTLLDATIFDEKKFPAKGMTTLHREYIPNKIYDEILLKNAYIPKPQYRYPFLASLQQTNLTGYIETALTNLNYKVVKELTKEKTYVSAQENLYIYPMMERREHINTDDLFKILGPPNEEQLIGNCVLKNYYISMQRRLRDLIIGDSYALVNQNNYVAQQELMVKADNLLKNIFLNMRIRMTLALVETDKLNTENIDELLKAWLIQIYENNFSKELGKPAIPETTHAAKQILPALDTMCFYEEIKSSEKNTTMVMPAPINLIEKDENSKKNTTTITLAPTDFINKEKNCYIQAQAGMGKTTLLYLLFKEYLQQERLVWYIHLKNITDANISLSEALYEYSLKIFFPEVIIKKSVVISYIQSSLISSNPIFLLDGLEEFHKNHPKWLINLITSSNYRCVITSKNTMPNILDTNNVKKLRFVSISKSGIEFYINQFFSEDQIKADRVFKKIEQSLFLIELTSNPLLLNIICISEAKINAETFSLASLYKEMLEHLLENAFSSHEYNSTLIERAKFLLGKMGVELVNLSNGNPILAKKIIDNKHDLNILLKMSFVKTHETQNGLHISFTHESLNHFFAALCIIENYVKPQSTLPVIFQEYQHVFLSKLVTRIKFDTKYEFVFSYISGLLNLELDTGFLQNFLDVYITTSDDFLNYYQTLTLIRFASEIDNKIDLKVNDRIFDFIFNWVLICAERPRYLDPLLNLLRTSHNFLKKSFFSKYLQRKINNLNASQLLAMTSFLFRINFYDTKIIMKVLSCFAQQKNNEDSWWILSEFHHIDINILNECIHEAFEHVLESPLVYASVLQVLIFNENSKNLFNNDLVYINLEKYYELAINTELDINTRAFLMQGLGRLIWAIVTKNMKNFSNYKEVVNHQYIENCVSLFYQLAGDGNIPEVLRAAAVDAMGSISILSKNTLKHIALLYELAKNTFNHQLCSSSILALGEILNNFFGYIYELLTASDDGPSDSALEFISNEEINLVPILNLFSNLIQNTDMPENLRKAGIQALVDVIEALIAFWKLGNKNTNLEDAELEKEPLAIANVLSLLMMNDSLAPSLLSCLFQALDNLCSRFFFKNIISRLSENKRKDLLNDILGCKSTVLISYIENDNMDVKVRTHALQLFFRILIITKTLYFSSSFLLIPIILNDGFTFSQKMHALRLWYIIDKKSLLTKSMTDLLVQLFAEDDFLVKQALFTVISFNLMEHAKPFYLENNKLFFYDNNQLLSIELNAMPIEIYINELHDLKENLMQLITKDKSEMPFILPGKHIELSFFS